MILFSKRTKIRVQNLIVKLLAPSAVLPFYLLPSSSNEGCAEVHVWLRPISCADYVGFSSSIPPLQSVSAAEAPADPAGCLHVPPSRNTLGRLRTT